MASDIIQNWAFAQQKSVAATISKPTDIRFLKTTDFSCRPMGEAYGCCTYSSHSADGATFSHFSCALDVCRVQNPGNPSRLTFIVTTAIRWWRRRWRRDIVTKDEQVVVPLQSSQLSSDQHCDVRTMSFTAEHQDVAPVSQCLPAHCPHTSLLTVINFTATLSCAQRLANRNVANVNALIHKTSHRTRRCRVLRRPRFEAPCAHLLA